MIASSTPAAGRPRSPSAANPLRSALKKKNGDPSPPPVAGDLTSVADPDTATITSLGIPALRATQSTASVLGNASVVDSIAPAEEDDDSHYAPTQNQYASASVAASSTLQGGTSAAAPPSPAKPGAAPLALATTATTTSPTSVPVGEDTDRVVAQLLEIEGGLGLLLDRVKQNLVSTKDIIAFLKKRAAIEEEYGKALQRLSHSLTDGNDKPDGKGGIYADCIRQMVAIHDTVACSRLAFATHITQVCEELTTVCKDTERSRRQLKDAGERHEKLLVAAEVALDKAKTKQEATCDAWDRARQALADAPSPTTAVPVSTSQGGFGMAISSSRAASFFGVNKSPERDEEAARHRAARANDAYQTQLAATLATRAEFQSVHLPGLLRSLKEVNDECDIALQYHLSKYAFHYEQALTADAFALCPSAAPTGAPAVAGVTPGIGIRKLFERMDHAGDLQRVILDAAAAASVTASSSGMSPASPGAGSDARSPARSLATASAAAGSGTGGGSAGMHSLSSMSLVGPPAKPMFGVSLMDLSERDDTNVPRLVQQLTRAIEDAGGLDAVGVYRASGSSAHIQRLRAQCDRDFDGVAWRPAFPAAASPAPSDPAADLHALTGLLKLFFRCLPDSLLPRALARELVQVAKLNDAREQVLRIHAIVNRLPDPHYATLRHLMYHLNRVAKNAARNKMTAANLSIVFGPTLMHGGAGTELAAATAGVPPGAPAAQAESVNDMHHQCKVVELILKNCQNLFEEED
ncbi:Rho GTPase-activating protein [Blastocladiella emersonii ATCC 22665]|nr:Rho GTPase-activating protein [Blastocladiella emersonii ATCC 22665]